MSHEIHLLADIGICVIAAAVLAYLAHRLKQPLILAYLLAGLIIGPQVGLHWVTDKHSIETVAEIGLILLLFIIGLEIDLKKLVAAGKPVILTGAFQFILTVVLALGFFALLGFRNGGGDFSLLYLAICVGLSSTMIVVKLLYDKFELDTLPGRITLGVLVFQDIWAIVVLAIQPNLLSPEVMPLVGSVAKGVLLLAASLLFSRYVLPPIFRSVAKMPELVLVMSLAWCFALCAGADYAGLSREMGALIAGISISSFPYNLDVVAKIVSIRDFFVTLFFVALGMQIPMPTVQTLTIALAASLFLVVSRFVVIFPILHSLRMGNRVSLIPAINLAQMSEFSMVIASIGLAKGHISQDLVSILILVFAITSTASTYLIRYSHEIYERLQAVMQRIRLRDLGQEISQICENVPAQHKRIILLGFFREASSLLHEFEMRDSEDGRHPVLDDLLIIDFNPEVYAELQRRDIACIYGDIAHMETLHHAHIHQADLVVSTITDAILKGTDNLRILQQIRRLCPQARVIVTADQIAKALTLYQEGADFVFLPRLHSAREMAHIIETGLYEGLDELRAAHKEELLNRREVLA
jgi:Kef-type K+ transport system membrane component KefB